MTKQPTKGRIYGTLLTDLANARSPDDACNKFAENIQAAFDFDPQFIDRAKRGFPFASTLESLSRRERIVLKLLLAEKRTKGIVETQLFAEGTELLEYDQEREIFTLRVIDRPGDVVELGPDGWGPDPSIIVSKPYETDIFDLEDEVAYRQAGKLMLLGRNLLRLKDALPEERFDQLSALVKHLEYMVDLHKGVHALCKSVELLLDDSTDGKDPSENTLFLKAVEAYNETRRPKVFFRDGKLESGHAFEEEDVQLSRFRSWKHVVDYSLVKFFLSDERKHLKTCKHCDGFYIAARSNQKYCGEGCRGRAKWTPEEWAAYQRERRQAEGREAEKREAKIIHYMKVLEIPREEAETLYADDADA